MLTAITMRDDEYNNVLFYFFLESRLYLYCYYRCNLSADEFGTIELAEIKKLFETWAEILILFDTRTEIWKIGDVVVSTTES